MSIVFGAAIYLVVWWIVLFTILPIGVTTQGEAGDVVPGTPASAPVHARIWFKFALTTGVSTIVFAIIYFTITQRWIDLDKLPGGL